MRKFRDDVRVQGTSLPEIVEALEDARLRLSRLVPYQGHKLKQSHLINAIVLHFLELPQAQQDALGRQMVARLEVFMAGTGPVERSPDQRAELGALVLGSIKKKQKKSRRSGGAGSA